MISKEVVCRYVFTVDEYKTTRILALRLVPVREKLFFIAILFLFGAAIGTNSIQMLRTFPRDMVGFLPLLIFLYLVVMIFGRLLPIRRLISTRKFRKGLSYNGEQTVSLSPEGIGGVDANSKIFLNWNQATHAVESVNGFAVYLFGEKRSFLWLPVRGFSSPTEVDCCRNLIQTRLTSFRKVNF